MTTLPSRSFSVSGLELNQVSGSGNTGPLGSSGLGAAAQAAGGMIDSNMPSTTTSRQQRLPVISQPSRGQPMYVTHPPEVSPDLGCNSASIGSVVPSAPSPLQTL